MESNALEQLVSDKNTELNWSTCVVSDVTHFACAIEIPSDTILFCFLPTLSDEPFIASLPFRALHEQCQNQGFLNKSFEQIQAHLRSQTDRLSSGLSFRKKGEIVQLTVDISSSLKILLEAKIIDSNANLSVMILRRLLDDVLTGSDILRKLSHSMRKVIDDKDRALLFLKEHLEESDDKQVLNKWAPLGSQNHQALEKYDNAPAKEAIFGNIEEEVYEQTAKVEVAEYLFTLERDMKDYKNLHPTFPHKKRKAVAVNSDFAPIQESSGSSKNPIESDFVKLEPAPFSIKSESPVRLGSPGSSRDASESPTKKRKFRKVRISK